MADRFQGMDVHVRTATKSGKSDSGRVLANPTMRRLNHSLSNVESCRQTGDNRGARNCHDAAACFLDDIDAMHAAAHAAFDEVSELIDASVEYETKAPASDPDADKAKRKSK